MKYGLLAARLGWTSWHVVSGRGLADGVAVDDEFDTAIALAAFGVVVRSDRLSFAEALSSHRRRLNALFGQKIADAVSAAFGELLVEVIGANAVGVALNLKRESRVSEQDTGDFCELFAGSRLESGASGVDKHVGHVDDEPAGGIACL